MLLLCFESHLNESIVIGQLMPKSTIIFLVKLLRSTCYRIEIVSLYFFMGYPFLRLRFASCLQKRIIIIVIIIVITTRITAVINKLFCRVICWIIAFIFGKVKIIIIWSKRRFRGFFLHVGGRERSLLHQTIILASKKS